MSTIAGIAIAVKEVQTKVLAADAALVEAINQLMVERDGIISDIAKSMERAADHLEKHRAMLHNLLHTREERE